MFSATMTEEVDMLIDEYFTVPEKISVAASGTRLDNIEQQCYSVPNFYTKVNLLSSLLNNKDEYGKVLVFVSGKKTADKLFEELEPRYGSETSVIHSNKSQNYRLRSVQQFDEGTMRILIATDVMARGLDLEKVSHVINFDTPYYPENYIHRIGRTGRAEQKGKSVLFFTDKEKDYKEAIEILMDYRIPEIDIPGEVEISKELLADERPKIVDPGKRMSKLSNDIRGPAFHEKKEKNKKTNRGGSYLRKRKTYKKPKTRGDKITNRRKRRR
jgi:ATP-dependent RNA helicase RhlE